MQYKQNRVSGWGRIPVYCIFIILDRCQKALIFQTVLCESQMRLI